MPGQQRGRPTGVAAGLDRESAGFDVGQYADQPSDVQAVVDMFGPSDLTDMSDSSVFIRVVSRLGLGGSREVRQELSPVTYAAPGAPPFMILHGREDKDIPMRHSTVLADRLRAAGVPVTARIVDGAGHGLAMPGETPTAQQVTDLVVEFFAEHLGTRSNGRGR